VFVSNYWKSIKCAFGKKNVNSNSKRISKLSYLTFLK
jgi:hypothetical protein